MATTADEVLQNVRALGYGTDTEGPQLLMLSQLQKRIVNARRWTFLLETVTKTTTAGAETVALDATLGATQRVDAVWAKDSGSNPIQLEYVEPEVLKQYTHDNTSTGRPRYWSRFGQNLILYPIPDATYTLTVDVVKNPAKLATKSENVIIPDSHTDILVWGVIEQISFRERDWDGHNFARQMYAELFTEMLAQYGMPQRQQATHVTDSGQWDNYDPESAWPVSAVL